MVRACGVLGAPPWWCGVDGVALLASVSLTFRHLPVIWLSLRRICAQPVSLLYMSCVLNGCNGPGFGGLEAAFSGYQLARRHRWLWTLPRAAGEAILERLAVLMIGSIGSCKFSVLQGLRALFSPVGRGNRELSPFIPLL
ncbi:hypothetical protein IGI04_013194, partial [Brassica rapa subsp. trilocularis]